MMGIISMFNSMIIESVRINTSTRRELLAIISDKNKTVYYRTGAFNKLLDMDKKELCGSSSSSIKDYH